MSNRSWANSLELESLIVKALANGADDWVVSTEVRTRAFLAEKESLLAGKKHPLTCTYFCVHGHVHVARLKSGFRKMIYDDAVDAHALHDFRQENLTNTIYYKAADDNLYFSLLFESKDNAHTFQNKLLTHLEHPFKKMTMEFNKSIEVIESANTVVRYVYKDDYKKSDSTSPDNSVNGFSVTELPNIDDPLRSLRSFEKLTLIPRKETIYGCHIAPKAFYKGQCARDPDNIIYGSHRFHGYFDGDGKRRPRGANLDWGTPPELWVDFVEAGPNSTVVNGVRYHEVFVNIMFRDIEEANSMRGLWKDGTVDIGDHGFHTSFFATNAVKAKKYLELKRRETRVRWGVKEDMTTPQNATIEEVEVGELADAGAVDLEIDDV